MRRRLVTVAIFLLAGAVVNVAVAWGIIAVAAYDDDLLKTADRSEWPRRVPRHWPSHASNLIGGASGFQIDRYAGRLVEYGSPDVMISEENFYIDIFGAGWPCSSLAWESWYESVLEMEPYVTLVQQSDVQPEHTWWVAGIPVVFGEHGFGTRHYERLPLRPIWPGFVINTLVYAATLWLIIPGPFALRRLIRHRRGLCPACGYDLRHGEHEACPECGVSA